jgi:hypothetical protein
MRAPLVVLTLLSALPALTQTQQHATHTPPIAVVENAQEPAKTANPLAALDFLLGTWTAKSNTSAGSSDAAALGTYTFRRDLSGHALARTSSTDACKGPKPFDCDHHDQLTIFPDPNGQAVHGASLFALYLDNEGHVIYYTITTPDPHTVLFDSQGPKGAPKFRLMYHLEGVGPQALMGGKFQMAPPGSDEYHSYLEWSGTKQ